MGIASGSESDWFKVMDARAELAELAGAALRRAAGKAKQEGSGGVAPMTPRGGQSAPRHGARRPLSPLR
eukprot:7029609-Lingulodinium_polyedra.AAC.1